MTDSDLSDTGPDQSEAGPDRSEAVRNPSSEPADRVRLSYRPLDREAVRSGEDDRGIGEGNGFADDHLVHERIRERPFRAYLRRIHAGPVSDGDEWTEFVNCGCGTTTDVVLRVEAVDGGHRLDDGTAVDLVPVSGAAPNR